MMTLSYEEKRMITIEERMNDLEYLNSLPKTRKEAQRIGSTKYFSGSTCIHGHTVYRSTANGMCAICRSASTLRELAKQSPEERRKIRDSANANWNRSSKGHQAKLKWKQQDPKWAWVVSAVGGARGRSKIKNLEFNLTNDYVYNLVTDTCPVLGTPLRYGFKGGAGADEHSPSIDRIDPTKGYVIGNVAVISHRANAIKSNASWEEVMKVAEWMRGR